MDLADFFKHLRERIGNPDPQQVNNKQLLSYTGLALEWVAAELKLHIKEERRIALVASERNYRLPQDCAWPIWVSWNGDKLTPSSTYRWDRDGTDWRGTTTTDTLGEFAVQGRQIILPRPPSATAITTDAFMVLRYIAGLAPTDDELAEMSDLDVWCGIIKAAMGYLTSHPTEENKERVLEYKEELDELLLTAKRRNFLAIDDYAPSFRPYTERRGAAR